MTHDDEYEVSEESLLQEWLQITRRTPQPPSKPRRKSADDVLVGPRGQRMRRKSADAVMELPPSKTKLPPVAEVAIPSWDADDDVPPRGGRATTRRTVVAASMSIVGPTM